MMHGQKNIKSSLVLELLKKCRVR